MKPYVALALIFGAAVAPPYASAQAPPWSSRGVFAFSGGLVLDFQHEVERLGPFWNRLFNCSTSAHFCATGEFVALVAPKYCRDVESFPWSSGDVVLIELSQEPSLTHPGAAPRRLLGDPARPSVVYLYDSTSIAAVYLDASRQADLVREARARSLSDFQNWAADRRYAMPLATLDAFGSCSSTDVPNIPAVTGPLFPPSRSD